MPRTLLRFGHVASARLSMPSHDFMRFYRLAIWTTKGDFLNEHYI
jgi:hypothetical protein